MMCICQPVFLTVAASLKASGSRKTRSGKGSVYKELSDEEESDRDSESEFEPSESEASSLSESSLDEQTDEEFNPFGGSDSDEGK